MLREQGKTITHLVAALITCRAMEAQVVNIRRTTWTP